MEETKHIHISDYDYPLPDKRIAKYPLAERDASKLLVYRNGTVSEDVFRQLPDYLEPGSLMVFNNTKVIQARLHFHKATGALIEVFCLEPHQPHDYAQAFAQTGSCSWLCMVGNLKKWKEGPLARTLQVGNRTVTLTAERVAPRGTSYEVRFAWDAPDLSFAEVLDAIGELPIPPYLNRPTEASDLTTYQTVYSKIKGSVAAPTAGLHFTDRVLAALDARGVERDEITLHVGAGTFKPVKSEEIQGHEMHAEWIAVTRHTVDRLLAHGGRCTAVGTTSVRTLESLYYVGVLIHDHPDAAEEDLHVPQWMPYDYAARPGRPLSTVEALIEVRDWLERNGLPALHTSTRIIIAPGYTFHVVDRIVTNFHQPKSTLLLLVSAFVGGDWRRIYDYALGHGFRFLSYGDSSLLFRASAQPHDNAGERLPLVDEQGRVVGSATRGECHDGSKRLHPVVHLHVFNTQGQLYLQRRPQWKDIQPGRWDTAVGGHVDFGEATDEALRREAAEEIGLTAFRARPLDRYVFESRRERELVHSFCTTTDAPLRPSAELDGGRFWSGDEIRAQLGKDVFTPNFEQEFRRLFPLTFRRAGETDIPLLRSLADASFRPTYRDILEPQQMEYMMEWMYSAESLRGQLAGGHVFFIAEDDEGPCGYVSVEQQGPDLFHLQKIYLLPSRQGRGYGRRLFRQATDYIEAVHPAPCTVELNVNRHNCAVGFYEHMGMTRSRSGDFDIGGGFYMNDYIMALQLPREPSATSR